MKYNIRLVPSNARSAYHCQKQYHALVHRTRSKANITEKKHAFACFFSGGAGGTRTLDLCVANAPLSQLSYNPIRNVHIISQALLFVNTFKAFFDTFFEKSYIKCSISFLSLTIIRFSSLDMYDCDIPSISATSF